MLQQNSFFSSPFIFFGSHEIIDDELEDEVEEEWNFSDPWRIALHTDLVRTHQQRIGLFIHWSDPKDEF